MLVGEFAEQSVHLVQPGVGATGSITQKYMPLLCSCFFWLFNPPPFSFVFRNTVDQAVWLSLLLLTEEVMYILSGLISISHQGG